MNGVHAQENEKLRAILSRLREDWGVGCFKTLSYEEQQMIIGLNILLTERNLTLEEVKEVLHRMRSWEHLKTAFMAGAKTKDEKEFLTAAHFVEFFLGVMWD